MKYVHITKLYDYVLVYIDEDMLNGYEEGCKTNILNYVKREYPEKYKEKDGEKYVSDEFLQKSFVDKYLKKRDYYDNSAKDCARFALARIGFPPEREMSVESLEKTIGKIFKKIKDRVYLKYSSGNGKVRCVDINTCQEVISHPDVVSLIQK